MSVSGGRTPRTMPGILARTALLSWLITIGTLLIFISVIIPEQKRIFLENLESKAQSVTFSIVDLQAGAVVNGDYSSVVDYVTELMKGDQSIEHLVLAGNAGFGLVIQRSGWYSTNSLPAEWLGSAGGARSSIVSVPLLGTRRAFQFSQPFSSSGIDWGWIHVGLSLKAYDHSVATVYTRTGMLAVVCILLGLMASVTYARRLVEPILRLRSAVERVAQGDLSARLDMVRSDELGSLAGSFNTMADAMLKRDRILGSVRFAAQQFLAGTDWEGVMDRVLAKIGEAAQASRVTVIQTGASTPMRREWVAPALRAAQAATVPGATAVMGGPFPADWNERFCCNESVAVRTSTADARGRAFLESRRVQSVLCIPVRVGEQWWGVLCMEDFERDRVWTDAEEDSLRAAADMLGAAIVRQRGESALIEANETLELRVDERTRELQQQVAAKEQARADLADAQQRLMDLSRQSGMAEVATGVLHNVGNVLNSVNVSANLLHEWVRTTKIHSLTRAAGLLKEHDADLVAFLSHDAKGRQIPAFVVKLAEHLEGEVETVRHEVDSLLERVEHIKQIVSMQQGYASTAGIVETLSPAVLMEDAIRINAASLSRHGIEVVREFLPSPDVTVDKHAVLQILINLVRNAKDAMNDKPAGAKRLVLGVEPAGDSKVRLRVADNGIGIPTENLTRMFAHGFTTKKEGHGFGLHSGANAAKAMGGQLTAWSAGPGTGATLVLELPAAGRGSPTQPV